MSEQTPPNPTDCSGFTGVSCKPSDNMTRRGALSIVAKVGGSVMAAGALMQLAGCSTSAQKMVNKKGGLLGKPIPSDPIARAAKPSPVYTPSPRPSTPIAVPLSSIPEFVIPRSKWTKASPKRWLADPMTNIHRITVHHDAIMPAPSGSYADSMRRLNVIRSGHLNKGWADIGYHFAIDPKGRIWQARPLELQGAHVKYNNPGNIGIVVFGNYEQIRPTQASLNSIDRMVSYAMQRFRVSLNHIYTHQELRNTLCPGRFLQEQMKRTRATGGKLALAAAGDSLGTHS